MNATQIKLSVLALAALISGGCSQGTDSKTPGNSEVIAGNIVGGVAASDTFQKENGVVALVIRTVDGEGLCTGTLISKRIVLTAAHCLDSRDSQIKSVAVVFTQEISKATKENVRFGIKGLQHNLFQSSAGGPGAWNDIALLKLNEDAPTDMKFARLPSIISLSVESKASLIQAGFGKTQALRDATGDTTGLLKQVGGIEVLKLTQDRKEMLLKEDGKGSCNGDSGGPAFARAASGKLVQVGVNSRGTDPNSCIGIGVFTTVAAHLSWIQKNSELLMADAPSAPTTK